MSASYSKQNLSAIFSLGRLYLEMGYYVPAEKIFSGLIAVDGGSTAAKLAMGVLKLEQGHPQEAGNYFRAALAEEVFSLQAKLGIAASFVSAKEIARALSMLQELAREVDKDSVSAEMRTLWVALKARCAAFEVATQ